MNHMYLHIYCFGTWPNERREPGQDGALFAYVLILIHIFVNKKKVFDAPVENGKKIGSLFFNLEENLLLVIYF